MTLNPNQGCTCYRPWHSITPPPPCPLHSPRSWINYPAVVSGCTGRHCAHDAACYGHSGVLVQRWDRA